MPLSKQSCYNCNAKILVAIIVDDKVTCGKCAFRYKTVGTNQKDQSLFFSNSSGLTCQI
jgi:ribosomal protein S27AE